MWSDSKPWGSSAGGSGRREAQAAASVNRSGSSAAKKGTTEDKKVRWEEQKGSTETKKGVTEDKKVTTEDKKVTTEDKKGDILAHLTCQNGYLTTRTALRTWRGGQLPYPCWLPTAQTYYLQHKKPQYKMPHGLGNKNRDQMSLIN